MTCSYVLQDKARDSILANLPEVMYGLKYLENRPTMKASTTVLNQLEGPPIVLTGKEYLSSNLSTPYRHTKVVPGEVNMMSVESRQQFLTSRHVRRRSDPPSIYDVKYPCGIHIHAGPTLEGAKRPINIRNEIQCELWKVAYHREDILAIGFLPAKFIWGRPVKDKQDVFWEVVVSKYTPLKETTYNEMEHDSSFSQFPGGLVLRESRRKRRTDLIPSQQAGDSSSTRGRVLTQEETHTDSEHQVQVGRGMLCPPSGRAS